MLIDLLRFSREGRAVFGELTILRQGAGYLVYGPGKVEDAAPVSMSDADFRDWIRTSEDGGYRPLAGARSLRHDWSRACEDEPSLRMCLAVIYPLALEHAQQQREGRLRVVDCDEVLRRQSGYYRRAAETTEQERMILRRELCSRCVRNPVWGGEAGDIPCPEPCSVLVALSREVAIWHEALPEPAEENTAVGFAEFGEEGNVVREAVLRSLSRSQA